MFFKCKICAERDKQIELLKSHIAAIERFIVPVNSAIPTTQELEADAILSGHQQVIEIPDEDYAAADEILSERDRLLSATY